MCIYNVYHKITSSTQHYGIENEIRIDSSSGRIGKSNEYTWGRGNSHILFISIIGFSFHRCQCVHSRWANRFRALPSATKVQFDFVRSHGFGDWIVCGFKHSLSQFCLRTNCLKANRCWPLCSVWRKFSKIAQQLAGCFTCCRWKPNKRNRTIKVPQTHNKWAHINADQCGLRKYVFLFHYKRSDEKFTSFDFQYHWFQFSISFCCCWMHLKAVVPLRYLRLNVHFYVFNSFIFFFLGRHMLTSNCGSERSFSFQ